MKFFLESCIDQIKFTECLVQPDRLRTRLFMWAEEESRTGKLPAKSGALIEAILYRGELPRSDVVNVLNVSDRQARRVLSPLVELGVIVSDHKRAPLRLAFPAELTASWMPGLFPEKLFEEII